MSLQEQLQADLKAAMIGQNSLVVSTLRLLNSEIKNAAIKESSQLTEDQIQAIIRREVKKRHEAAVSYRQVHALDRATQEEAEADILQAYLPAQIPTEEVENYIKTQITTLDTPQKGELIRLTLTHFSGRADGKTVSELVNQLLP